MRSLWKSAMKLLEWHRCLALQWQSHLTPHSSCTRSSHFGSSSVSHACSARHSSRPCVDIQADWPKMKARMNEIQHLSTKVLISSFQRLGVVQESPDWDHQGRQPCRSNLTDNCTRTTLATSDSCHHPNGQLSASLLPTTSFGDLPPDPQIRDLLVSDRQQTPECATGHLTTKKTWAVVRVSESPVLLPEPPLHK